MTCPLNTGTEPSSRGSDCETRRNQEERDKQEDDRDHRGGNPDIPLRKKRLVNKGPMNHRSDRRLLSAGQPDHGEARLGSNAYQYRVDKIGSRPPRDLRKNMP
jgi:hypothetical protein